ncbi:zinc-binding dehydrogenase [Mycobacterium yunnanensis]|uniref:Zinc-binding dehydrogenase n=1 Tax=Mycobacterium yunnanensis TaxID=368477 RepID=A0A9X2YXM0_9MYCO|nr:zinc-binding dehydrogenase [Mycobacterium yunnanensis]MCV7420490.1 zinc-binding dehydrogenase [Mycobacterium yunnanensis]
MRAVAIQRFGDPTGMAMIEAPCPIAERGQVIIETGAIGVGGVDAMIRRGTVADMHPMPVGLIPGSEVAGVVAAVGADVDESWIGRRVWAFTGVGGGYTEVAKARVGDIVPIPDDLTFTDAVAIGSAGPVAHFALSHAHFGSADAVLVRGAAGSIGIATVELAARAGAQIIAVTTSSTERGTRLREFGATHVLDRAGNGDASAPESFDVIVDVIGGALVPAFIDRLAPNGRMVLAGMVAGPVPSDVGSRLLRGFQLSRSLATFSLDTVPADATNRVRREQFVAVTRGGLSAVVQDVLPLDRAADAHRLMDAGQVFGRIVLTP